MDIEIGVVNMLRLGKYHSFKDQLMLSSWLALI